MNTVTVLCRTRIQISEQRDGGTVQVGSSNSGDRTNTKLLGQLDVLQCTEDGSMAPQPLLW